MRSENLLKKWQDPVYREAMRIAHLGQKAWNKGIKTGLVPKTAFKKGHKKNKKWYEIMKVRMSGKNSPMYKHGLSGTPEYHTAQVNKRRARKIQNGGYFTAQEWIDLKKKHGNKCLKCKRGDLKLAADHVIPLAKGGSNSIENIQPLCIRCNAKKHLGDTDYRDLVEVSIILPCFNQQDYLIEAIESALKQTIPCEIIFINDGSNDSSLELARRYPIRVVNQVNKGLASARNTGIMWSTGDFVLPLDCDDVLKENAVERILEIFKQNPNADIISPSFRAFGFREGDVILIPNPTLEDFKSGNRIGYCSAIKREALLECGGYSSRMTWGYEDMHLTIDLLTRGKKIVTIPEVLWFYRTKENSMITEAVKHHNELMSQIYKDFPKFV